jgi:hypothetical protein
MRALPFRPTHDVLSVAMLVLLLGDCSRGRRIGDAGVPTPPQAGVSGACTAQGGGCFVGGCCLGLTCNQGSCVTTCAAEGETCEVSACCDPLVCQGVCTSMPVCAAVGEPCARNPCCAGLTCVTGICHL